ncbi:uncharacterized protein B0H18DRAFT_1119984 [Fomitopsis serialis]|uniref:uncharacterized protein n=1 Tax=Fomitopsis serialis TaxID=139415 RepID=UPI0020081FC4|nr:uncharacterized protein B0H18DRAFT_1119984 [Neoantrodia serialis]KAH9924459.1 hypothetical protein B0H18DRAFT_1119984 [Neoantrodia serialis]
MAASRAFQIGDILGETLNHLYPDPFFEQYSNPEKRETLASCARVNKFVHEFALDVLWSSMDDLHPLFKVLPAFQRATVLHDHRDRTSDYILFGRLSSEDLHRFQLYAQRIITLHIDREYSESQPIHPSVLLSLYRALGHQPLLPRLRTLSWRHDDLADHDVLYFVSPSLRSLSFRFFDDVNTVTENIDGVTRKFLYETLCEQVATAAPGLETLTVMSYATPYYFVPFGKCGGLREVAITGQPSQYTHGLGALSSLDNLTRLHLRDASELGQDVVQELPGFRGLKAVRIEGDPRSICRVLMGFATSDATLCEIEVEIRTPYSCDPQTATDLLSTIKSHFSVSLHKLTLSNLPLESTHGDASPSLHPLPLLFGLRNLHTVYLFIPSRIAVSDEDLCAITSSWANIVSLRIRWKTAGDVVMARPTLDCLPRIARSCPHLRMLYVSSMDLTFAAGLDTYPSLSHHLDFLGIESISDRQEIDVMDVALLLDRLFPFLDIKALRELYERLHDGLPSLARVCDQLQAFQVMRTQARKQMEERNF